MTQRFMLLIIVGLVAVVFNIIIMANQQVEDQQVEDQLDAIILLIKDAKGDIKRISASLEDATRTKEKELSDKTAQLQDKDKLLATKEEELTDVTAQLATKKEDLTDAKAQLATKEKELTDARAQLATKEKELAKATFQLHSRDEVLDVKEKELATTKKKLDKNDRELALLECRGFLISKFNFRQLAKKAKELQMPKSIPCLHAGKYRIENLCSYKVFTNCDMETDGGGWIVIQRKNYNITFYHRWYDYEYGFGDLDGEFWYGLHNIHTLTTTDQTELRIELGEGETPSIVWTYKRFHVSGPETGYELTVSQGSGEGDNYDSITFPGEHAQFHTFDRDTKNNCAKKIGGGWWYNEVDKTCSKLSNLNGVHYPRVSMKICPNSCSDKTCRKGWFGQ